jgi:hypothetical protein
VKQIVEEVFEFFAKVVTDKYDMVAQINLVLAETLANLPLE